MHYRTQKFVAYGLMLLLVGGVAGAVFLGLSAKPQQTKAEVDTSLTNTAQVFIQNDGYIKGGVDFFVQGSTKSIYLNEQGFTFIEKSEEGGHTSKLVFDDANVVHPISLVSSEAPITFFKGSKDQWRTLKSSKEIIYPNLWDGISLKVAVTQQELKYTYEVDPHADPSLIRMHYEGATVQLKSPRELRITTPSSEFIDAAPESYQLVDGDKKNVDLSYAFDVATGSIGFSLGRYDKAQSLVIDPVILLFATLLGGDMNEEALGLAVDSTGVYVAGDMYAPGTTTFTPVVGPDTSVNNVDGWVAKYNLAGTALVYAGFIGGDGTDTSYALALDSTNNAYVVGDTTSGTNFPATVGPDTSFNSAGSEFDTFICKVNAAGTSLVYCGYIGGSAIDQAFGVAVDSSNRAYVVGVTTSTATTFPDGDDDADDMFEVPGFDQTQNGGEDGYAVRVSATGSALEYGGFIGGSAADRSMRVDVDTSNNAYVAGHTGSTQTTFPDGDLNLNDAFDIPGFDQTANGSGDNFLLKVAAAGTSLSYATFMGGSTGTETVEISVKVRPTGSVVFAGQTSSTDLPTTGPFVSYGGGARDGYFGELTVAGTGLTFLSYLGGSATDLAAIFGFDSAGNMYLGGSTGSTQASFLPTPSNGPDSTYNGGIEDAFAVRFDTTGQFANFSGYIGGGGSDWGYGGAGAVTAAGVLYMSGASDSSAATFPDGDGFGTLLGQDQTPGGNYDAFIIKISLGEEATLTITADVGQLITFSVSDSALQFGTFSPGGPRFATNSGGTGTETAGLTLMVATNAPGGYLMTLRGAALTSGINVIDPIGATPTASTPGIEQFGVRYSASGGSGVVTAPYATALYAYTADATTSVSVASSAGPSVITTYSAFYLTNISDITPPGAYSSIATYVATASF